MTTRRTASAPGASQGKLASSSVRSAKSSRESSDPLEYAIVSSALKEVVGGGITCSSTISHRKCTDSASAYCTAPWQRGENSTGTSIRDSLNILHLDKAAPAQGTGAIQPARVTKTAKVRTTRVSTRNSGRR